MTEQMTPLRRRMLDDMTIRNMSPSTQKIYVRAVANFSIFHGRSPDKLTFEDVRDAALAFEDLDRGLRPHCRSILRCRAAGYWTWLARA